MPTLDAAQLSAILPVVLGLVVAGVVELLTKADASPAVKRTVAAVLSLLAGVIPTVALTPHETTKTYVAAVFSAWVVAIVTHTAGLTAWLQELTPAFGIGHPTGNTEQAGTPGLAAGTPTLPEPDTDAGTTTASTHETVTLDGAPAPTVHA